MVTEDDVVREPASSATQPIKVFIVDDHAIVRHGLKAYLIATGDFDVIGDAPDGVVAVAALGELIAAGAGPDVALVDLVMPRMDGIAVARALQRIPGAPRIVILTSFADAEHLRAALQIGVVGYVLKTASAETIADAVREASRGRLHLDATLSASLTRAVTFGEPAAQLTPREREVVALIAKGRSNRDIAAALFISERTARTHVSHLLGKLGLESRIQLAIWAHDNGFPLASTDELLRSAGSPSSAGSERRPG
jgi:DNA-binding NarL/FixJ family response regulator